MSEPPGNTFSDFPPDQFEIMAFCESCGHQGAVDRSSVPEDSVVQDLAKRLRCSACGSRDCSIRIVFTGFLCRHCYDLPYGSQNETYMDRMMRKARKVRQHLGASESLMEPVWERPKGMHWKTFERLVREREANQASTFAMAEKFGMFERKGWLDS